MNQLTKIVVVGGGGLGREVLALLRACNGASKRWEIMGFLDADQTLTGKQINGTLVLGQDSWCEANRDESLRFVGAVGNPRLRSRIVERLTAMSCKFASVIHPDVRIPDSVHIGVGSVIMAGTYFTTDAKIGSHVIIYPNCCITHDVSIADFCMIPPGCNLSGAAILETGVELGAGVSVLPGRRIGEWTIVGAGSVVTQDIPAYSTAVGVPCRVIKQRPRVEAINVR
jgi:sugar O-acyltransferase (sialic acid O-acetyltransferase NeuD family)